MKNLLPPKWFTILVVVILIGVFFGTYLYMPNIESYKTSIEFIKRNDQVSHYLGENIQSRLAVIGWSLQSWRANFKIHTNGEKGKGVVYIYLTKSSGVWKVVKSDLILEDGTVVTLIK